MSDRISSNVIVALLDKLIVVFDIETTGVNANDDIIAIGIVGMTPDRQTVFKYRVGLKIRTDEEIEKMKSGRMTWSDFWIRKGYDLRCFDRFWKTRTEMLNKLQNPDYID